MTHFANRSQATYACARNSRPTPVTVFDIQVILCCVVVVQWDKLQVGVDYLVSREN